MKIGEIYFVRERDRTDGAESPYVKIGMVNDVSKDSVDRLREHQTGNPRDLHLHHVTRTPGPFRIERFLHQQFGPHRVRNEWFRLTEKELETAIQIAERLAAEAFVHVPFLEQAAALGSMESTEPKLQPTETSSTWLRSLSEAKTALKVCNELSNEYRAVATTLSDGEREEAEEEELFITEHYVDKRFDADGFATRYPELAEKFTEITSNVSGSFRPKLVPVDLSEIDPALVAFADEFRTACSDVRQQRIEFGELFDLAQQLERFAGSYSWVEDVADAQLRVICGTACGIEDQITWNRTTKERHNLDLERLEFERPNEFNEFVTTVQRSRMKIRKRARKLSK